MIIILPSRYTSTNIPSERGNLLRALGETRDVFVIQKYLDMTLNQVEHEKQICKEVKTLLSARPRSGVKMCKQCWRPLPPILQVTPISTLTNLETIDASVIHPLWSISIVVDFHCRPRRSSSCLAPPTTPLAGNLQPVPLGQVGFHFEHFQYFRCARFDI